LRLLMSFIIKEMKIDKTIKYVLSTELLFTLLPIIIIGIVRSAQNDFDKIFFNTEWSIIALILFGQSIVKFSSGISKSNEKFRWQFVALIISLIIVFGLIPTSIILVINLTKATPVFWLYIVQILLFVASIVCFFIPGAIGQKLLDESKK